MRVLFCLESTYPPNRCVFSQFCGGFFPRENSLSPGGRRLWPQSIHFRGFLTTQVRLPFASGCLTASRFPLERGSAGREAAAQGPAAAPGDPERGLQQPDPDAAEAERLPAGAQHHAADPDGQAAGDAQGRARGVGVPCVPLGTGSLETGA